MYQKHRVRYTSDMGKIRESLATCKFFLLATLFLLTASSPANADLKFEPYLGYWTGKLEVDSNYYMATSGLLLGSRLGLRLGNLSLGADYMYSSGSGNQSGSTGDYSINEFGPYIGLEMPGVGQLYATAFISSKAKLMPDVNSQPFTGSGYRIGVGGFGWARLKSVSLNFELISRSYKQYNGNNLNPKQKELAYALTASMPLPGSGSSGSYSAPTSSE